jgi:hypothetical protein
MTTKPIVTKQFYLLLGASLAVASLLLTHRDGPAPDPEGPGVVFVYFPSLCAQAGDPSDCHEISRSARPSFESMAACSAYADVELRQQSNPRLMASCMKQREG